MRLWTFQTHEILDTLFRDGVWYSCAVYRDRTKPIDMKYIQKDVNTPFGSLDTLPIYCFLSLGDPYPVLSLKTLYNKYSYLAGYMKVIRSDRIMVELEVPETFILNSKESNNWYKDCDASECNIAYDHHLEYYRKERSIELESLTPYIKLEHVAAIRKFSSVDEFGIYGTHKVETIYTGINVPLWSEIIYCNGDGYPRDLVDGVVITLSHSDIDLLCKKYGMPCTYSYMSIEEICSCCNDFVFTVVGNLIKLRGYEYDTVKSMTLIEMENKWRSEGRVY